MSIRTEQLLIRLEPEIKNKIRAIAKSKRRDMNSLVLIWFDEKLKEAKNATGRNN